MEIVLKFIGGILVFTLLHLPFIGYMFDYRETKNKEFLYVIPIFYLVVVLIFILKKNMGIVDLPYLFVSLFVLFVLIKFTSKTKI